jgi:hypothetical protein
MSYSIHRCDCASIWAKFTSASAPLAFKALKPFSQDQCSLSVSLTRYRRLPGLLQVFDTSNCSIYLKALVSFVIDGLALEFFCIHIIYPFLLLQYSYFLKRPNRDIRNKFSEAEMYLMNTQSLQAFIDKERYFLNNCLSEQ